jgi:dienelactone hydrolase
MRCLLALTGCWAFGIGIQAVAVQADGEVEGKNIRFVDGKVGIQGLEFVPAGMEGPRPAILVVHGEFGLTPWVQKQCSRLARKGYYVLALDLYEGELPKTVEEAHILERGLEDDRVHAQLKLAVDRLSKMPAVRKEAMAILGWDTGGGYALDAALVDNRLKAAVNCYGRLTTDSSKLAKLETSLLCLMAGKDEGISKETVEQFQAALKKVGKEAIVHTYPEARNGFMDPKSPYGRGQSDAGTIDDAWRRIDEQLAKALGK